MAKTIKKGTISFRPGVDIPSVTGGKSPAMDFTEALTSGNPSAVRALNFALKGEEPSLADRFIVGTYDFAKILEMTANEAKKVEPAMAAYRNDMRHAHRFVLDNEFVRLATEISSKMTPEKLLVRLQYATLPYDTTWIEFDLKTKVQVVRAAHGLGPDDKFDYSQVGDRLGLLLHRLDDTTAVCQLVCELDDRVGVVPTLIAYFFSLNERDFTHVHGKSTGCRPLNVSDPHLVEKWAPLATKATGMTVDEQGRMADHFQRLGRGSLWGFTHKGDAGMLEDIKGLQKLTVPKFLERHGVTGYSRMYPALRDISWGRDAKSIENLMAVLLRETTEFTGMIRWLVVVLAMLNEVPVHADLVAPTGQIRVGLTAKRKLLDYHRVTLRLPKTDPVKFIERRFRNTHAKHRAHEVRAHWRTYLHETHCSGEEHEWTYDYDEGYRLCGKCMAFGRLIHEHIRGDASLGWVRKDYVVKPSRQE